MLEAKERSATAPAQLRDKAVTPAAPRLLDQVRARLRVNPSTSNNRQLNQQLTTA
jgi:hypothetical protein